MIFINLEMIFQLLLIKNIRMRLSVFTALKITAATDTHLVSFLLGITLTLGFVFMLIVDNCGSRIMHRHSAQSCRSSFELIFRDNSSVSVLDSSGSLIITKPKATWTATLGLVVHAAADGIALGKYRSNRIFDFLFHSTH